MTINITKRNGGFCNGNYLSLGRVSVSAEAGKASQCSTILGSLEFSLAAVQANQSELMGGAPLGLSSSHLRAQHEPLTSEDFSASSGGLPRQPPISRYPNATALAQLFVKLSR